MRILTVVIVALLLVAPAAARAGGAYSTRTLPAALG